MSLAKKEVMVSVATMAGMPGDVATVCSLFLYTDKLSVLLIIIPHK